MPNAAFVCMYFGLLGLSVSLAGAPFFRWKTPSEPKRPIVRWTIMGLLGISFCLCLSTVLFTEFRNTTDRLRTIATFFLSFGVAGLASALLLSVTWENLSKWKRYPVHGLVILLLLMNLCYTVPVSAFFTGVVFERVVYGSAIHNGVSRSEVRVILRLDRELSPTGTNVKTECHRLPHNWIFISYDDEERVRKVAWEFD
ncbi:MAG: hypothetical protein ABIH23_07980 [bacterium]